MPDSSDRPKQKQTSSRSALPTKAKGDLGEQIAVDHLRAQGYRILRRNYRCRRGEIDIVAAEGDVLCFVEVRSVASRTFGDPLETVNTRKQARILHAARHYLATGGVSEREIRFDVIGIVHEPSLEIRLVRSAFECSRTW